ncbi:uncharacterized protein C8A04DRAFT_30307 [Dichotomopilus funicola]|uniref:C2H2-type domain-containing protein n=1 Tax=Dichotomopilus funicola TaxID=1934379 RepID=A0AAN6V1Y4_9PEZI|nr:hypothetical protein C8A04DRAFT_30307 [Dichotomopilus funicola]
MERSDSQSSSCTVGSSYTISTGLSAYSTYSGYTSATDSSPLELPVCDDGTYEKTASSSSYPDPSTYYEHADANHVLSATGSQYQYSSLQNSQALQLSTPFHPLGTQEGNEEAAWQATLTATSLIIDRRAFEDDGPAGITSVVVEASVQRFLAYNIEEPVRPAIQEVLYQQLRPLFNNRDYHHLSIIRLLEEAAYQLQIRLQDPKVLDVSFWAIATVLHRLSREELEEHDGHDAIQNRKSSDAIPHSNDGWNIIDLSVSRDHLATPDATQAQPSLSSSPNEKEKFPCPIPGCLKVASRLADVDRHVRMTHVAEAERKKYFCDYKRCARHTDPFFRPDHFRDHLRGFHMEDLLKRSVRVDRRWWATRAMMEWWWRCNRCFMRVVSEESGYVCSGCGNACEKERQIRRARLTSRS